MGMALTEKKEVFGRGATKAWHCQSISSLGKALAEGRAAGHTASLPWKQPKSWLVRFRNVSCLGLPFRRCHLSSQRLKKGGKVEMSNTESRKRGFLS